jgi:hypothetical protein
VPNPDVVSAMVGEETVLLATESGVYYTMNAVAARAWALWENGETTEATWRQLVEEFDAPAERVAADLQQFIDRLLALQLATWSPGDAE